MKIKMLSTGIIMGLAALATAQETLPPNIRVNALGSLDPNEVTIAINPANPLNLVAGANLTYVYYSMDGGETWTENNLTCYPYRVHGDPSVIFDADGHCYYGHLSNPLPGYGYWIDRIVVQKSTDGGANWDPGQGIGFRQPKMQDKEWLAADITDSPYRNRLYVSWTEFDSYKSTHVSDSSRIRFSHSADRGATWSSAVTISDHGGDCRDGDNTTEGAVPSVGPDGEVYVAWSGPLGILFDRSLDGGQTFGRDVFVTAHPGGWAQDVWGFQRVNGMPVTGCDISHSPYRGTVYVLWSDTRNGDIDIFLSRSTDRGESWTPPIRVNGDDSSRDQFFPWLAVDPVTGAVYAVFYDRRNNASPYDEWTDVTLAASYDGGQTFVSRQISEQAFDPSTSTFLGDYINVAAYGGRVHAIWTRMDSNARSVITTLIDDTENTAISQNAAPPDTWLLGANYPNPFNPMTTIPVTLKQGGYATVTVFDERGRQVATPWDGYLSAGIHDIHWNAGNLASGVYLVRLEAGGRFMTRKCVLSR